MHIFQRQLQLLFSNPNMLASYLSRKIRYHNYTQFMIRLCLLLWNILLSVGKKSILFVILQEELDEVVRTWNSHKPRMCLKVVQSCCVQSLRCLVQRTDGNWVTKKRWIYLWKGECTPKGQLPCAETVFELSVLLMQENGWTLQKMHLMLLNFTHGLENSKTFKDGSLVPTLKKKNVLFMGSMFIDRGSERTFWSFE